LFSEQFIKEFHSRRCTSIVHLTLPDHECINVWIRKLKRKKQEKDKGRENRSGRKREGGGYRRR
jgi:hypothetical protein